MPGVALFAQFRLAPPPFVLQLPFPAFKPLALLVSHHWVAAVAEPIAKNMSMPTTHSALLHRLKLVEVLRMRINEKLSLLLAPTRVPLTLRDRAIR